MDADEHPDVGVNNGVLYVSFPNTHENVADPGSDARAHRAGRSRAFTPTPAGTSWVSASRRPATARRSANRSRSASSRTTTIRPSGSPKRSRPSSPRFPASTTSRTTSRSGPRELRVALNEHRASHSRPHLRRRRRRAAGCERRRWLPSTFKDPDSDEDVDIRVMLREDAAPSDRRPARRRDSHARRPPGQAR